MYGMKKLKRIIMKTRNQLFAMLIGVGLLFTTGASAQYNKVAGENVIKE